MITLCGLVFGFCANADVIYVNPAASGAGNGSSWTDAFTDLQDAIAGASLGQHEIWLAQGTYTPTTSNPDPRTASFAIGGMRVLGGFTANPAYPSERVLDPANTILSGEIGTPDPEDNVYHVVINTTKSGGSSGYIEGITIRDGYANGPAALNQNKGAGAYIFPDNNWSWTRFIHCVFEENTARGMDGSEPVPSTQGEHGESAFGGAVYTYLPCFFENVRFSHNQAIGGAGSVGEAGYSGTIAPGEHGGHGWIGGAGGDAFGGAVSSEATFIEILNCIFEENTAN